MKQSKDELKWYKEAHRKLNSSLVTCLVTSRVWPCLAELLGVCASHSLEFTYFQTRFMVCEE